MDFTEVVSGLEFPEGPVAMPDGSVILVEVERGTLSRVTTAGKIEVIAALGGGPNGAALGPDGWIYVCNNGGMEFLDGNGLLDSAVPPVDYQSGRIDRVNPDTGEWSTLYTECDGLPLNGPNDLVFDRSGGFYFTDYGKSRGTSPGMAVDLSSVFYAQPDGSSIKRVTSGMIGTNGCGLSADEKTLFVAETITCRLWALDVSTPGQSQWTDRMPGRLVHGAGGFQFFDSLALDIEGRVCIGTLVNGGVTSISADGSIVEHFPTDDIYTTNICFGGENLETAYLTLSTTGRLLKTIWPRPGLPLNFLNT